jgi:hypothetical protein
LRVRGTGVRAPPGGVVTFLVSVVFEGVITSFTHRIESP